MIVSRDLSEACMCSGKTMWICRFTRQKEHNNMCLAIEKMKEKGRREEREKSLKALEKEREKSSKALEEEREKSLKALNKALEEEREKSSKALNKALEEEREKSSKALDEERKNGICNLIEGCRKLGETLEKTCQLLMMCYHLTQSEAAAYLKEYYV